MVKVVSTYVSRLSDVINACLFIEARKGLVSVDDLASHLGLSDRMLRDYLSTLASLGVLEYLGGGNYRVVRERINLVMEAIGLEPFRQLRLTDFIDPNFIKVLKSSKQIEESIMRVLERLNLDILFKDGRLRREILDFDVGGAFGNVLGERFIYPKAARRFPLDNIYILGTAAAHKISDFGLGDFAVVSNIYLGASGYLAFFRNDVLNVRKSISRVIPDLVSYKGREPFVEEDPFYEITTTFPELLGFARNIAARLLMEILHYKIDLWFLENYADKFDVLFRAGSLVPHGFVVESKKLIELKNKMLDLFYKLIRVARENDVLIVGVTHRIHDNIFAKTVERALGKKFSTTTDDNFLQLVMEDGDVTGLIFREREKGRPKVSNWYEFYMKNSNDIIRFDFIAFHDPFEDYEKIRDLAFSSWIPAPTKGLYPGPSPISTSQVMAKTKTFELDKTISALFSGALKSYLTELEERINEERFKDAFGEE